MAENQQTIDMTRMACDAYHMSDAKMATTISLMSAASLKHLRATYEDEEDRSQLDAILPLFENIMPEISARLFARDGITLRRPRLSTLEGFTGMDLREAFIEAFQSDAFRKYLNILFEDRLLRSDLRHSDLITSPVVNGNIVAIALDRLEPPLSDEPDRLARIVKITGSILGLECEDGIWRPEFTAHHHEGATLTLVSDQVSDMVEGDDDLDAMDDFDLDEQDEDCGDMAETSGRQFEMAT